MTALVVWALIASVVAGVQTLRVGDLKDKLGMPELPAKSARKAPSGQRRRRDRKGPRR